MQLLHKARGVSGIKFWRSEVPFVRCHNLHKIADSQIRNYKAHNIKIVSNIFCNDVILLYLFLNGPWRRWAIGFNMVDNSKHQNNIIVLEGDCDDGIGDHGEKNWRREDPSLWKYIHKHFHKHNLIWRYLYIQKYFHIGKLTCDRKHSHPDLLWAICSSNLQTFLLHLPRLNCFLILVFHQNLVGDSWCCTWS